MELISKQLIVEMIDDLEPTDFDTPQEMQEQILDIISGLVYYEVTDVGYLEQY